MMTTDIFVESLYKDEDFDKTLTRADFEQICRPIFNEAMEPVQTALSQAQLTKDDISDVLLVGGSTRIPKMIEKLSLKFGEGKVNQQLIKDMAIARGAAIQAAMLKGQRIQLQR